MGGVNTSPRKISKFQVSTNSNVKSPHKKTMSPNHNEMEISKNQQDFFFASGGQFKPVEGKPKKVKRKKKRKK